MAIAHVATTVHTSSYGTTSTGLQYPSGLAADDVAIVLHEGAPAAQTGWTQLYRDANNRWTVFARILTGSESGTTGYNGSAAKILHVFRGVRVDAGVTGVAGAFGYAAATFNYAPSPGGTPTDLPALTTTRNWNWRVAAGWNTANLFQASADWPVELIERADANYRHDGISFYRHYFSATEEIAAAGAAPARTVRGVWPSGNSSATTYFVTFEVVAKNQAPNAPTGLSPDGVTIDRTVTQRFSWSFSDPDSGDSQSKYDLRYRLVGATTWTVVSGTTPNRYHDFASGTFVAGDYEWQVRTYDAQGLVGPYSASAFFTAATPPTGPTISDPTNGQTIARESHTVVWSYPTQEAFQVRTVADSGGVADATTVYTDSGEVVSSTARSRLVDFPVNGRTEHVQVRVRDAGLWSPWVSVKVLVSYTAPQTPFALPSAGDGSIQVAADVPPQPPGPPTFTRASTAHLDGVEVASGVPRYPDGTSILVEEGTTNLLTANQASVETDTTGWQAGANTSIARSTAQAWHGAASLEMTSAAAGDIRAYIAAADGAAVTAGTIYTASAWFRTTVARDVHLTVNWYDSAGAFLSTTDGPLVNVPAGVWTRVTYTVAAPTNAAKAGLRPQVKATGAAGEVHYVDGAQVEAKGYATSWHPGGATRQWERLSAPASIVTPTAGTVEVDVDLRHYDFPSGGNRIFEATRHTSGGNGLLIYMTGSVWRLHVTNDSAVAVYRDYSLANVPAGQVHRFAVTWNADGGVVMYVDGAAVTTSIPASALPSAFYSFWLGTSYGASHALNNPIDAARVSDRARTADELADWTAPLTADDATTYLLRFQGDLTYATGYGEFDGTEAFPDVISMDIHRRKTGDVDDGIRIAAALPPSADFTDWAVASGVPYEYRVRTNGDNGVSSYSAWAS